MRRGITTAARAGLIGLAVLMTGCGWFRGDDAADGPSRAPLAGPLGALASARAINDIYSVFPNQGPLPGGQQVSLDGNFPAFAGAETIYTVFFGANAAAYDTSIVPFFTTGNIRVVTPPGDAPGLVDVILRDTLTALDTAALYYGYEYLDPFDLIDVVPDAGPLPGGQQVDVIGRFPILANISTIAQAYSAYKVYFGANLAGFDAAFDPIITRELMHVITPPGDMLGFVDVTVFDTMTVIDAIYNTYNSRTLIDGYEYVADIELTDVDPDNGFILGDPLTPIPPDVFNFVNTPVTLTGTFPVFSSIATAEAAYAAYGVYFGPRRPDRRAFFDSSVTPVITAERMYVRAPIGEDVGPVDVSVVPSNAPAIFAELERAYRYYSMYIGAIIPPSGPLSGGNPVRVEGLFLTDAIFDLTVADQIYSLFFDVNPALFDIVRPPLPIITMASIDLANKMYVANSIYVAAPPGDMPGFVDVIVMSDLGREPRAISDPLKYEYEDDFGIGQWIDASVQPNPVGKLPSGHLLVRIVVSGTISDATTEIFIVPQGGNPANPNHRIQLIMESIGTDLDDNTVWTGTNAGLIDTVTGPDAILTDGHAAIFIHELETDNIVGLSDDDAGRIDFFAEQKRHFIIDTIPPRMLVNGPLTGINFFNSLGVNSDTFTTTDVAEGTPTRPYPVPSTPLKIATEPIPWDLSTIQRQTDFDSNGFDDFTGEPVMDSRAQIFYNTGSFANDFVADDLRFNLFVTFEDVNVYRTLGLDPDPLTDGDAFNSNDTRRQVAGFAVVPDDPAIAPPPGDRDQGVLDEADDVLIKWEFQPAPSASPNILNITTIYDTFILDLNSIDASAISTNLARTDDGLTAFWDANTGIEWTAGQQNMLMQIVFRGVDRAGNYFPQGDPAKGIRKNWTLNRTTVEHRFGTATFDQSTGPLNLWWLVNTGTEFLDTNIPASENTRTPNFVWKNSSNPDPRTVLDLDGLGPDRLFNFKLWHVDPRFSLSREEARDGPYTRLSTWRGWTAKDTLTANEIADEIRASEGTWMLLVVIAADEAGNLEPWPSELLPNPFNPFSNTVTNDQAFQVNISGFQTGLQSNWRRWYVAPAEQVVETEVRPTFWHDRGAPDGNGQIELGFENVLGNIEIVPLSARADESVSVIFRIDIVPDPSITVNNVDVNLFELVREGRVISSILVPIGPRTFTVTYIGLGDVITRKPVHYVFRATGQVTDTSDRIIIDSTPANFKFVVVNNVAEYIENRRSGQPIKELDRP